MPTATVTPSALSLGPGRLWWAPLGSTGPADHNTALAASFKQVGSTAEGSEFSYEISMDAVMVAESLDPLFHKTTGRAGKLTFAMAENTVQALVVAFNGGTVTSYGTAGTAGFKYEPPAPGKETGRMLVWESEDGQERWVFKQCTQGGSVGISRRKGADKATIPVEFRIEAPADGSAPWAAFYASARSGGATATP